MSGYTALPTKNPGDVLTSALWNTYLQGNADSGFARMLADSTLGVAAASIDFTSIPATFAHLMLVAMLRGDTAAANINATARMNNDSSGAYLFEQLSGSGASAGASTASAQTSALLTQVAAAASAAANVFTPVVAWIPNYLSTSHQKSLLALSLYAGTPFLQFVGGHWSATTAINRLTVLPSSGNFVAGSRVTLYGLPA